MVPPPPFEILMCFLVLTAEWTGLVVPPRSLLILLYSLVLMAECRIWSHGVWYCCDRFLPLG